MPNSGWFNAFSRIAGSLSNDMDRQRQMRMLDEENRWRERQRQMQEEQWASQKEMQARQLQQLDRSILGQDQEAFRETYGVKSTMTPESIAEAKRIGYGGLLGQEPTMALTPGQGMSLGPSYGLDGSEIEGQNVGTQGFQPVHGSRDYFQGTAGQRRADTDRAAAEQLRRTQQSVADLNLRTGTRNYEEGTADLARQGQFQAWAQANPKATPQQVLAAARSFQVSAPPEAQWLLQQETAKAQQAATLAAAGIRAKTAQEVAALKIKAAQIENMASQGNMNARAVMGMIRQAMIANPDQANAMLESVNMAELLKTTDPSQHYNPNQSFLSEVPPLSAPPPSDFLSSLQTPRRR